MIDLLSCSSRRIESAMAYDGSLVAHLRHHFAANIAKALFAELWFRIRGIRVPENAATVFQRSEGCAARQDAHSFAFMNRAELLGQTETHLCSESEAANLGARVHANAVQPFLELKQAAAADGFDLVILSG